MVSHFFLLLQILLGDVGCIGEESVGTRVRRGSAGQRFVIEETEGPIGHRCIVVRFVRSLGGRSLEMNASALGSPVVEGGIEGWCVEVGLAWSILGRIR